MKILSLLSFFLFFTSCQQHGLPETDEANTTWYSVKRFIDGDTFYLEDGSEEGLKVRLIGIDTPEPRAAYGREAEPFGKEASAVMKELIGNQRIRLTYDVDQFDRYGRTLAYAYTEDGTFLNAEIVRLGYAEVKTYPPNVKHQNKLYGLQVEARKAKRGMWAD